MRWKDDLLVVLVAVFVSLGLVGLNSGSVARAQTACDIDCLSEKVSALTRRVVALEKLVTVGKSPKPGVSKESFMNIGSGSASGGDWTKVEGSDFAFDQSLYGNVASVTWQGWIESGKGTVRLFDSTNGRGVDGSEKTILSGSGRASFYSGNLAIWRGQNQYYIQVKNPTLESVKVTGARLRIVTK